MYISVQDLANFWILKNYLENATEKKKAKTRNIIVPRKGNTNFS